MPRIVDLHDIMTPEEVVTFKLSPSYLAMIGRDAGDGKRRQKKFLRTVLGVKWKWRCAYCDAKIVEGHAVEVYSEYFTQIREWTDDHIVPQSRGGGYRANNIVPACRRCNSRRGARPVDDFLLESGSSTQDIDAWKFRQSFPPAVEFIIDHCLDEIDSGRRYTEVDVPWIQALGSSN